MKDVNMKVQVFLIVMSLIAFCSSDDLPPGAWIIKPAINDPIIERAVDFINEYYLRFLDINRRRAVDVINAYMRISNGYLYVLDIQVETQNKYELCHVEIREQHWKNKPFTLQTLDCKPAQLV